LDLDVQEEVDRDEIDIPLDDRERLPEWRDKGGLHGFNVVFMKPDSTCEHPSTRKLPSYIF
jgi:hypothetical protein